MHAALARGPVRLSPVATAVVAAAAAAAVTVAAAVALAPPAAAAAAIATVVEVAVARNHGGFAHDDVAVDHFAAVVPVVVFAVAVAAVLEHNTAAVAR